MDLTEIAAAIRAVAVFFSVIVCAYAGLVLMTSRNPVQRAEWKEVLIGVFVGLSVIFLAPLVATMLSGGSYC
jgi:type IV secretory pathway VirB2 component (pilin)